MKKKFIVIAVLFAAATHSQKNIDTLYNFKLKEGVIIWQKIYQDHQFKEVENQIKSNQFTKTLTLLDSVFSGRTNNTKKRVVKNWPYFATFGFDGYATVEFKNNKYRVTVKDIIFDGPTTNIYGVMQKQDYPLQLNVIKKNKIRNTKKNNNVLRKIDSILNSKFVISDKVVEDW